jgi:hypothetical protein
MSNFLHPFLFFKIHLLMIKSVVFLNVFSVRAIQWSKVISKIPSACEDNIFHMLFLSVRNRIKTITGQSRDYELKFALLGENDQLRRKKATV